MEIEQNRLKQGRGVKVLLGLFSFIFIMGIFSPMALALVSTEKKVYNPGEAITVTYVALPGNQQDWITIVPKGTPANKFGERFYTRGKMSGTRAFKGLKPGAYEVRLYFNWPNGGYKIQNSYGFLVEGAVKLPTKQVAPPRQAPPKRKKPFAQTEKEIYQPFEQIRLKFGDFPGHKKNWISVVESSAPDNKYGSWFYSDGKRRGTRIIKGLPRGEYEVRAYILMQNGGYYIQHRHRFSVR